MIKWAPESPKAMAWTLICAETTIAFTNAYINNICINIHLSTTPISLILTQDYQVIQQQFVTVLAVGYMWHATRKTYNMSPSPHWPRLPLEHKHTYNVMEGNGQCLSRRVKLTNQQGVLPQQTFSLQVTLTCVRKTANGKLNRILCLAQVKSLPDDCWSLKQKQAT